MSNDLYTYVKNLHEGEADPNSKGCSSWREFWERKTGRHFSKCSKAGCTNFAVHGGHVIKANSIDRSWYIVPLCATCNNPNNTSAFQVRTDDLVPVNN